jgi:hypothetical protein
MLKMNRFLEVFWAAISVVTLCMGLYVLATDGYEQAKYLLILTLLPVAIWITRRGLRIQFEKKQKEAKKKKHND